MAAKLEPGALLQAAYRLERVIGQGGMGVVWAAERVDTGARVAVKLLKDAAEDPHAGKRLLREARAASAVVHPNVVSVVEVLELEDGAPAIVMERLEGEPLRRELERRLRLDLRELAERLVPVVSAVGAAHEQGVIHRDLKPENIFLVCGADGVHTTKVLDFGIAKLTPLDGEATRSAGLTTTAVIGTPAYMAPEQVFGESDIDHRADVWALGLIFYQCLSGTLPTAGDNVGQVLKNVVARPFEPIANLVPDLPPPIGNLVMRMIERDRSKRPDDLREVLEALAPFASAPSPAFGPPARRPEPSDPPPPVGRRRESVPTFSPFSSSTLVARANGDPPPRAGFSFARRRAAIGGAAAVALVALGVAKLGWPRSSTSAKTARPSPLAEASTSLACPVFRASGSEEPSGWLGAAAAATACERARVILGGRPDRTRVPAELLGLPRQPVDGFPADPYASPDARERSLTEARKLASAYLDGEVTKQPSGFSVNVSLASADGVELGRAHGEGRALYEAVRSAMTPLVASGAIPRSNELDPVFAAWSETSDADAALELLDLTFAIAHNAGSLSDECARFEAIGGKLGDLGPAGRSLCAYTVGRPAPPVDLGAPGSSPPAIATRIRVDHLLHRGDAAGDADRVHELFEHDTTPWGRSLLAATESCLAQAIDPKRAYEMAILAVIAEPKNPDGQGCNPWEQLITMALGTANAESTARAVQAWAPWNGSGWLAEGLAAAEPAGALRPLRRAYELTPFDAQVVDLFGDKLLAIGGRQEARAVALAVRSGGYPVHQVESDLLLLRVEASEASFGSALERAERLLVITSDDAGWVRAQRFEAAWRALEIARILGRASEIADRIVERFVDPDPPLLDASMFSVTARLAAVCAESSEPIGHPGGALGASDAKRGAVGSRCFARLRALRGLLSGGITAGIDDFVNGAERYLHRDYLGAAKAWRPLMRGPGELWSLLPDAMSDAFDRAGDVELAERVDASVMLRASEYGGATLAHVRAARRALARGDRAKARARADEVILAWSVSRDEIPAVAEMRRLRARLKD